VALLSRDEDKDVIQSDPLGSTKLAGMGAVITAVAGVIATGVVPAFEGMTEPVQVAGIGAIGLAAVAWAIATAGDAIARAYATSHVVSKDGENAPALPKAVERFAEAYETASLGTVADPDCPPRERTPALAAAVTDAVAAYKERTPVPGQNGTAASNGSGAHVANGTGAAAQDRWIPVPRGIVLVSGGQRLAVGALIVSADGRQVRAVALDANGRAHVGPSSAVSDAAADAETVIAEFVRALGERA
jgi:hypothetical protein